MQGKVPGGRLPALRQQKQQKPQTGEMVLLPGSVHTRPRDAEPAPPALPHPAEVPLLF